MTTTCNHTQDAAVRCEGKGEGMSNFKSLNGKAIRVVCVKIVLVMTMVILFLPTTSPMHRRECPTHRW